MRLQVRWSQDEKSLLNEIAEKFTMNKRINWVEVAKCIPNRTANQCKTQYSIVLQNKEFKHINNKWDAEGECQLQMLVTLYGKKWNFIQKNYYQNLTTSQIRQKYTAHKQQIENINAVYKKLATIEKDQYQTLSQEEIDIILYEYNYYNNKEQKQYRDEYLQQAFCNKQNGELKTNSEYIDTKIEEILKLHNKI